MVNGKHGPGLTAQLQAGVHNFVSDVSEKLGGKNEGADPHELLEASLAACTIITVQMYANRKGWNLESTDVAVKIVTEGAETQISRELSFRGDLTAEQKSKLVEIADKCPIHRLLESKVTIETLVRT